MFVGLHKNINKTLRALTLVVSVALLSAIYAGFPTQTASAADGLGSLKDNCEFDYDEKQTKISVSCKDYDGGDIVFGPDTKDFKKTGAKTFSLTSKYSSISINGDSDSCTAKITIDDAKKPAVGTISGKFITIRDVATGEGGTTQRFYDCDLSGKTAITVGVAYSNTQKQQDAAGNALAQSLTSKLVPLYCSTSRSGTPQEDARCRRTAASVVSSKIKTCSDRAYATRLLSAGAQLSNDVKVAYRNAVIDCLVSQGIGSKASVSKIVTPAITNKAIGAATAAQQDAPADLGDKDEDDVTTCAIDGIGWIICPVMNFMAKLNDAAFGFLNDFLAVRPALFTDPATKAAWRAFRDIANVLFVVAFMVIIYSQLTGAGITNYGIKKMLPKLFIAAVLVNVSFHVCALAVDLSNILGSSLYSLFKDTIDVSTPGTSGGVGGAWSTVMGGALAVGAIVLLIAVLFLAPAVLLAFAVVILILVARQAFVILLIVVAPIAFVAYLLPNTESWFKKWWKAFSATLMVYPIIAVVFGVSSLASNILMKIADDGGNGGDDVQMLKIVALGVLAIPLFAVPALLKGSLSAAGAIGTKLSNLSDRSNKYANKKAMDGRIGEAKTAFDARRQLTKLNRRRGDGFIAKRGRRMQEDAQARGDDSKVGAWLERRGTTQKRFDESKYGQYLGGNRGAAAATSKIFQEFDEEVKRQKTLASGRDNKDLLADLRAGKGSEEYQAAIAGTIMSRDHRESHLEALEITRSRNQNAEASRNKKETDVVSSIQKQMDIDSRDKPWALGDQAAGQLGVGTFGRSTASNGDDQLHFTSTIQEQLQDRVGKKLSAQSLATMNPDEMKRIRAAALTDEAAGGLNQEQRASLVKAITEARSTPQVNSLIKPEAAEMHVEILAQMGLPPDHGYPPSASPAPATPSAAPSGQPASPSARPSDPTDDDDWAAYQP